MNVDPIKVLDIIRDVAAAEILPRFQTLARHEISEKKPGDLVTIADIEAERKLSEKLTAYLPGSNVVGEEGASRSPRDLEALERNDPVWIIDPVDGTQNFADGKPCFAVMVALCSGRTPRAGWIYDPVNDRAVHAVEGQGAWSGAKRLTLPNISAVSDLKGSVSQRWAKDLNRRRDSGESGLPKLVRRYRCVGREYMDMAFGKLHFLRYGGTLKPWDHVPGIAIIREMGGYDAIVETGMPFQIQSEISKETIMIAGNIKIWEELAQVLAPSPVSW